MLNSSLCMRACVFNLKKKKKKNLGDVGGTSSCISLRCSCKSSSGGDWSGTLVLSWFLLAFLLAFLRALERCPVHTTSVHGVSAQLLAGTVPGCACTVEKNPPVHGAGCRRRGGWVRVLGLPHLPSGCRGSPAPCAAGCAQGDGSSSLELRSWAETSPD